MVPTSDADWYPTFIYLLEDIGDEIRHDAQLSTPKCTSNVTFNKYGEFRETLQYMHYFNTLEFESYEDIDSMVNTCVEFHHASMVMQVLIIAAHFLHFWN